jgi:hypothetical protein
MKIIAKAAFIALTIHISFFTAKSQPRDTIFVDTYPDSSCIRNINIPASCGTSYMTSATLTGDSISIFENDTSTVHYRCPCNFDVSTTFFGLSAGTYRTFIFRSGFGVLDTLFVGSVNFTVPQSSPLPFSIQSNSSPCHAVTAITDEGAEIPKGFSLLGSYPNPFNPVTIIRYQIYKESRVKLEIFNELGQTAAAIVDEVKPAGDYEVTWDASKFSSGIYFCRLTVNNDIRTHKMTYSK